MRANVASPSEPPPIARNKAGQVVGSEAASRLAKIRAERCKQTGEKYRNRGDSWLYNGPYANKRLRNLLRNIIEEILSVPVEFGKGQTVDIIDELRRKVARMIVECEDPKLVLEYTNMLARYTVAAPKAEEAPKTLDNRDLEDAFDMAARERVKQRAKQAVGKPQERDDEA